METVKKDYKKPELETYKLALHQSLLAGSGGSDVDDLARPNDMDDND